MTTNRTTVIGVFEDRAQAQRAVEELKRLGFTDKEIGVVTHDHDRAGAHGTAHGSHAEEGAIAGVATGAGIGALWGIGIAAGLALPVIGPVLAGGSLAAILASAATGAAAAGLAGGLIGMGIPEEEATYYEGEFKAGRTIVTVNTTTRQAEALAVVRRFGGYDHESRLSGAAHTAGAAVSNTAHKAADAVRGAAHKVADATSNVVHGTAQAVHGTAPTLAAGARAEAGNTVQLREEQLHVNKSAVETGEVRLRKEVHTEHKTIEVPVTKEEVVIERTPVSGARAAGAGSIDSLQPGQEIRIPVREEQVHVEKTSVVKEEVKVGKRKVQDTETVAADLRKEDVRVETEGNVDVRGDRSRKTK